MRCVRFVFGFSIFLFIAGKSYALNDKTEVCAEDQASLSRAPLVENALFKFGGAEGLIGEYRMTGLVGAVSKTKVEFKIEKNEFWVSINGDVFKQVHLCYGSGAPLALANNTLRLKVLKPKHPKNGTILIRPGGEGNSLLISAQKSRWKFVRFKRFAEKETFVSSAD